MQNLEQLIERISRASGLSSEEINRKIDAKRAKLSGLISKEGAAQIVAAELGINFEKEKIRINEITNDMKKLNVIGKITRLFPVKEYKKNDREGKIASFILADETSNVRTVMWDTNHIKMIESGEIKEGDVVEISSASMRNNELHLTGFSDIKLSAEVLDNVKSEVVSNFAESSLESIKPGQRLKARAFIVQAFEPKFFEVCPQCGKKAVNSECLEHGKIMPSKRALMSIILDDGKENIRAVLFQEQIEKLIPISELTGENFIASRSRLLGEEKFFSGNVKHNEMFNKDELIINNIEEINKDELIKQLEK